MADKKTETKAKPAKDQAEQKKCAITREQFRKGAKPLKASINDIPLAVMTKEFDTGTLGWFANGQSVVEIDGTPVKVTYMVQVFVANSKQAE